ncbi:endonuclease V [Candidatus Woesearchaeota archaeon]|nr:endonuclease V [Candidatus Woesearchaeota archaeon]
MVDFSKLKEEQLKLAKKVTISDSFGKPELIGGVDCSFNQDDVIAAIVVCSYKTMEVKEKVFAVVKAKVPYVQGFLAYREGPAISEAYSKLENKPDILIVDGNGILHPRRCGLASHIGVLLEQATIGIAKQLLIGEVKEKIVYIDKEARAEAVVTREHSKPVYVSPGHKTSLKTSVEIVKNCMRFPHKLPEPLHLAHRYANEVREKIAKGEIKVEVKE